MVLRLPVSVAFAGCLLLLGSLGAEEPPCGEPPPVVLDVRLLTVSEALLERLGVDFETMKSTETPVRPAAEAAELAAVKRKKDVLAEPLGLAFLNDLQVLQLLQTAQGDRRTHVMQAPRLTLAGSQVGKLDLTETKYFLTGVEAGRGDGQFSPKNEAFQVGFRMSAKPVVSADARSLQLVLAINHTELVSENVPLIPVQFPLPAYQDKGRKQKSECCMFQMFLQQPQFRTAAFENTIVIPDGSTAAFVGAKRVVETRHESATPVFGRIPYVNRLFTNVGYGRETISLLILVTPRIMPHEADNAATAMRAPPMAVKQAAFEVEVTRSPLAPREESGEGSNRAVRTEPAASPAPQAKVLAEILRAYDEACAAGRAEDAERLARAALALNPACFRNRR